MLLRGGINFIGGLSLWKIRMVPICALAQKSVRNAIETNPYKEVMENIK